MSIDTIELDFDWTAPGALGAGYMERLLKIQECERVYWSEHQSAWIVTRHADIMAGLRDVRLSNRRYHLELEHYSKDGGGPTLDTVRRWVFNNDGREHMRLRSLLMKPFSKGQADSYRPTIRALLKRYLDRLENREICDFFQEFAAPFVAESLLHIIGFTGVLTTRRMIGMANAIVSALVTAGDAESVRNADAAIEELTPLIEAEIEKRRREPQDDLLTSLVHLSEGGERLSVNDVVSIFHVLVLAAIDTTAATMSLILPVLDESAERRQYLRENPQNITAVIDELQRYIGMQNMMHRIVGEDFEWHGKQLRQNQMIFFMLSAGNWDPRVFEHADVLDFERERKQLLTFAPGLHHCIGVHIARMELEETMLAIFNRFDRVRILTEPTYQPNYMTRTFNALEVRFEK